MLERKGKTRLAGIDLHQNASISISKGQVRSFSFFSISFSWFGCVVRGKGGVPRLSLFKRLLSDITSFFSHSFILSFFPLPVIMSVVVMDGLDRIGDAGKLGSERRKGRNSLFL